MDLSNVSAWDKLKEWMGYGPSDDNPLPSFVVDPKVRPEFERLTDWLPYTAYEPHQRLFVLEYKNPKKKNQEEVEAVGFTLELTPQTGVSEEVVGIFSSIIQNSPTGSCMQLHMLASNDLRDYLNAYVGARKEGLYRNLAEKRAEYYRQGAKHSNFQTEPYLLKNFRLVLSCTMPCTDTENQNKMDEAVRWREQVVSTLKSISLFRREWTPSDLVNWNAAILNPQQMWSDEDRSLLRYDAGRQVRAQMMDPMTIINLPDSGAEVLFSQPGMKTVAMRAFSVRNYPEEFSVYQASALLGDVMQTTRSYTSPYMITLGWRKPDYEAQKNSVQMRAARATQQAESPMVKLDPSLRDKKVDWDIMQKSFKEGKGGVEMYHQILLFAPKDEIIRAEEQAKSVWKARTFELAGDTYMGMQAIFASLPMSLTPSLATDIRKAQRFSTKALDNVIHTAPIIADWTGVGSLPVIPLHGRRGPVGMIDLYANSAGNYNGVIVGTSGSGKTFFANELVTSYLGTGAKVWVIDVGKGYKKQCDWAGGQFMSFGPNDDVRMNPFPMVRDINEDMEIIHPLVAQMAIGNSSQELSLIQYSSIGKAIRLLWDEYGNALTISNIRDKLKTGMLEAGDPYDKEVADLATMLDKFCVGGAYGKYFDGPPNIDFSSDFIVLELEELNGKKDLQAVVLLMMIYRITEEMFRTSRDRQKIVLIDEAWDLLAGGRTAAEFIEKGYRRARKYEGSFLTATQGINDYYKSPAATAALDNADWMFILRQKPEAIASFEKTGRLVMSDGMRTMMGNLRMVENEYSDLYVSSPVGAGLMRCIVDPFSTVLYSSRGASDTEVDSYLKQGMTVFQAIEKVVERKRLMQ